MLAALFGIFFLTVASGAALTASRTTSAWFDASISPLAYGVFMIGYLIILIAIALFGAIQQRTAGGSQSLSILAGPALVVALFIGAAGILLPASQGYLQAHYQLNTGVILTMSYSWIGVAFYFAIAVGMVLQQKKEAAPQSPGTQAARHKI